MKEGAENVEKKLQAKVESMKNANDGKGEYERRRYFVMHLLLGFYELDFVLKIFQKF